MFKKLLVASVVLAASSSVLAGPYKGENYKGEAPPCPTCQFMSGPYLGLSIGSRTNWRPTQLVNPGAFQGFSGILSLGYSMMINPMWYLGAEFFAGDTARLSIRGNGPRSTWDYGLDIIPGVMIADCIMGYARGGVIRTEFGSDNWRTGWRVGLGAQATIVQNWAGRMEYVYNQFGSGDSKRQASQVNVGVVYNFDNFLVGRA
jgi:opacity protein-like surface antigen